MKNNPTSRECLSHDGLLSHIILDFQSRSEQIQMAEFVEQALAQSNQVIVEAGTGTGKTFAYLVPALLSGHKTIISTGTKNLQDQLFQKDLPLVVQALGGKFHIALLKGRANYLCLYRLYNSLKEGLFFSRDVVRDLANVQSWSQSTKTGDIAELNTVDEKSQVWRHVTSTGDNCLGQECAYYHKCHVFKARQKAQKADVLVVNHHLFMADLALKDEGFGELFPKASAVIFDEAHQLPGVATQFFGTNLTGRQFLELASDMKREYIVIAKDTKALKTQAERLEKSVKDFRLAFGVKAGRGAWSEIKHRTELQKAIKALLNELDGCESQLLPMVSRSKGLEGCWCRAVELKNKLHMLTQDAEDDLIHWYETFTKGFSLNLTPMNVANTFINSMMRYECAWIFTSATITVNDRFDYFIEQLGLEEPKTLKLASPFDFKKQALFYAPRGLPQPNAPHYTQAMVDVVIPVLKASQGRAFLLFTSFRALYEAEQLLEARLDYPLLVQGSLPKAQLLDRFREEGNAILLGTNSFWEGVDVRGEALSCVIIDKLPFESPGDPILKARLEKLKEQGRQPFTEYQLPRAVINLKQGLGRLIRDANDRGVLMVCDPRLLGKSYGRVFLNSVPIMSCTRNQEDVEQFFNEL